MTATQLTDERIDTYMGRLDDALAGVLPSEREDILREIHAHIVDSSTGAPDRNAAIERVLRMLGTPEELARRYTTENLLARAGRSFSPWLLLHTSWRWAKMGIKGTVAFLVALTGYTTALSLVICVFLKPFMPTKVGMWIGPEGFNIGPQSHPERMHELLGNYFIPVIAAAAFLIAIGTTQLLRRMMRKRSPGARMAVTRAIALV
jgi:uncharacterized membrane protein